MKHNFVTSWTIVSFREKFKEKISSLSPRGKQILLLSSLSGGAFLIFIGLGSALSGGQDSEKGILEKKTDGSSSKTVKVSDIVTPSNGVDDREIWVNKLQIENEEIRRENESMKNKYQILGDKVDVLDSIFKKSLKDGGEESLSGDLNENKLDRKETLNKGRSDTMSINRPTHQQSDQTFPPLNSGGIYSTPGHSGDEFPQQPPQPRGNRIFHLGGSLSRSSYKNVDTYIPAGSHAKVALLSGVVAMTAVESQGNPLPIVLRVIDDGNLPRGFKSRIKNAQIIGACYGDISSERVQCRMETMSWVESDGTTVEKKIEGWLMGEDGRPGLRGEVVDRSGDVARQAMVAGVLGTMTSFLQMESTRSVYPVSPFGQTNALSGPDALKAAGAGGIGNALDKLADFAIKRAEQMQPVIVVASGRVGDVVFKSGVNVTPYDEAEMKMVTTQDSSSQNELDNGLN